MIVYWLRVFFCFVFLPMLQGQLSYADISTLDLNINDKIDTLLSTSVAYADNYSLDTSLMFARTAVELARESDDPDQLARAEYSMGYAYDLNGDLVSAIEHYENARTIYEKIDNKQEVANSMNAKGVAAYFKGDFELALEYYLPTIEYCEKYGIQAVLLSVLNNTGVIYRVTAKQEEAISIYLKSLALSRSVGDSAMIGTCFHNLGVAYNFAGDPLNSLSYLDSAIAVYTDTQDDFELGRSTIAKGETYYRALKNYQKARSFFEQGLEIIGQATDQEVIAKTYLLMAQVERDDNRYDQAEAFFEKGLSMIISTQRQDLMADYYTEMVKLYDLQGKKEKAYVYLKKYNAVNTQIQSAEKLKTIEELQTKYLTKQKEQEIELLNTQNELQKTQLTASRNMLLFLLIGLSIVVAFFYRLFKLNKTVKRALAEKDTLLREIHHRVKNNLQVISALLTLQSAHLKDAQAKSALQEGQDRVQSMALIHKDLYQHDNLKGVNTKDYFEQLIENLIQSYSISEEEIEIYTDIEDINLDVDTMIPLGLMINELISNALKHAFHNVTGNKLSVSLHERSDQLLLSIADNGVGVKNIDMMKNQSFGYSLVQSFAHKLDADIQISDDLGLKIDIVIKNYLKV